MTVRSPLRGHPVGTALVSAAVAICAVVGLATLVRPPDPGPGEAVDEGTGGPRPEAVFGGTFYYLSETNVGDATVDTELFAWSPGSEPRSVFTGDEALEFDAGISSDGRYLSHLRYTDDDSATIVVRDLGTGEERLPLDMELGPEVCPETVWAPDDPTKLLVHTGEDEVRWVDVDTGETSAPQWIGSCDVRPAVAPDGGYDLFYAHYDDDAEYYVIRRVAPDGTDHATGIDVSFAEGLGQWISGFGSVSADGERACVSVSMDDPRAHQWVRDLACHLVADTESGELVFAPDSDPKGPILFLDDGLVAVRGQTSVTLHTSEGGQLGEVVEPMGLRGLVLLAYVP